MFEGAEPDPQDVANGIQIEGGNAMFALKE
jgi:hypothetical protein